MSEILNYVLSFAKKKSRGKQPNVFELLYGYTQILSMGEKMLNALFSTEDSKNELAQIDSIIRKRDLDVDMMKKGLSLILSRKLKDEYAAYIGAPEELMQKNAGDVLQRILDSEAIPSDSFKSGCTLNDMIRLKNELTVGLENERKAPDSNAEKTEEVSEPSDGTKSASSSETGTGKDGTLHGDSETPSSNKLDLEQLTLNAKDLYHSLSQIVIGQDDAIDVFVRGFFKSSLFKGINRTDNRPSATFLFAGPPGVGKTLLASEAARVLGRPCLRLNMSEYSDGQLGVDLIGVSKKFAQGSKGKLTSFVESNPQAVIIFDEIEKAHLNVVQLCLQVLDEGLLQDLYTEKKVSFKETILMFTTNAGRLLYEDNEEKNLSRLDTVTILDALKKEQHPLRYGPLLPAAICSRFTSGNVIMFNHLSTGYLRQIVRMNIDKCIKMLKGAYGWEIDYDEKLLSLFLYHQGAKMDARIISSQSYQFMQDEIYEFARLAVEKTDLEQIGKFTFSVSLKNADDDIRRLFDKGEAPDIVVFGETDPSKAGYRKIGAEVKTHYAGDLDSLKNILSEASPAFVIIDPDYAADRTEGYGFSLDDIDSMGMMAFHALRDTMPQLRLYILDTDNRLRDVDRVTFLRQGASGFIKNDSLDITEITNDILKVAEEDYIHERIRELAGRGKHLAYNTAQKVNSEKTRAIIEFYDLKLYTAIEADDQKIVLDSLDRPKTTFSDVIGAENAVEQLKYFSGFLKDPKKFILNGAKPPKGILLYGPPGTGKTLLARAMAGETEATFFAANATDFMNKWIGEGEERIRKLFSAARKYAPSIIFIDEIDAIAKERTGESHVETYLNTLMTEMDGFRFDIRKPVFVLAATNFPVSKTKASGSAVIDPALLRRFDNKIHVDLPNKKERVLFLQNQLSKIKNNEVTEETVRNIADRTTGESLANLQNVLNLAVFAAGKAEESLSDGILLDSLEEFLYGKKHEWNEEYYASVAHHEAGHAYITYLSGEVPSFVTIVSRGEFGGYMQHANEEEIPSYTREQLLWKIRGALAGRASEIVFFGEENGMNTGVSGDLQTATNLALGMICKYGMSGDTLLSIDINRMLGSPAAEKILENAEKILKEELNNTIDLIRAGKEKVENLSQILLDKNHLMGDEIKTILETASSSQ